MRKNIKLWQLMGFAITSIGGTLLHFLYDWTNKSPLVAPFSAVNESTWEHMKLLFFPMLIFALVQGKFFKEYTGFWCIKLRGIFLGLILIPTIFYTFNGVIGKSPDWINIAIFFISAAISFIYEAKLFKKDFHCKFQKLSFIILCLLALTFAIFTFYTPQIAIFQDPTTKLYGIN